MIVLDTDVVSELIAAICRPQATALATRNTKGFIDTGIRIVNPWTEATAS
jgi:predicted nucleic acid-binding protein